MTNCQMENSYFESLAVDFVRRDSVADLGFGGRNIERLFFRIVAEIEYFVIPFHICSHQHIIQT